MNAQIIPQEERTQEEQQRIIKQLRQQIQLTHHEMHQLVSSEEQFVDKISSFNNISKQKINKKSQLQISQSLVYLGEAQKILQYAAGCGKNINRQLIICVLHNQACIYQILWELDQCSNYLQALIYNYESFFKESSQFSVPPSYINPSSQSQINLESDKMFGFAGGSQIQYTSRMKDPTLISKTQLKLLNYYYEHCAVSSQLQKNRKALDSAKKAIKLLKNSFNDQRNQLFQQMCNHKTYLNQNMENKYFLLMNLSQMSQKINIDQYKEILKSAYFSLQIWTNNRTLNTNSQIKEPQLQRTKQKLKDMAIGAIMQILPKSFNKLTNQTSVDDQAQSIFSLQEYLLRVFFLSVGYFSVATELRLLANSLYKNRKQQDKKNSIQYRQSMVYHLIAIIIASLYIPYQCHYVLDILASYSKHYACNLEEYKPVQPQSIQKIIVLLGFRKQEENLKNTEKMGRSTKQTSDSQKLAEANQYNLNCKTSRVLKNKVNKKKDKQSAQEQTQKNKDKLKNSIIDLKGSQIKKSRANSRNSRMKRSNSKHTVNIKDKIDKKYSQLQKILSSDNLILSQQVQKSPIKKLKSSQRQKQKSQTYHFSKDRIHIKKTSQKQKDDHKKSKQQNKKPKGQRKTKNSQKKQQEKETKPNTITEEDEQFFFYMTKKTTKTNSNQNQNLLSPKQSIKSISNSRRSGGKKSSLHSSRQNSKNSPRNFQNLNSPTATMQSPVSKGLNNIKKINGQKKTTVPNIKSPTSSSSTYRNYF